MQSQVIVPLDGSASAEAILPHALLFAQWRRSIMTLLQIVTPSSLPGVSDRMIPDNWSEGEEIWGAGLSGIYGQASLVKRRHGTNAAPGSGPGRASHCLVYQTPTAGAVDCPYDARKRCCRPRDLWERGRTGLCLCANLSAAAAYSQGGADCLRAYRQCLLPNHHCPARWQHRG